MNKEIRDACSVEIVECIYVKFKGKRNQDDSCLPILPSDDGVVHKFLEFSLKNEIFPVKAGGTSGSGLYAYCHYNKHKQKIVDFFKNEGIKVEEFHTNE